MLSEKGRCPKVQSYDYAGEKVLHLIRNIIVTGGNSSFYSER
jgi:hypothetical protein